MSVELKDFEDHLAGALRAHAADQVAPRRRHARRRLWQIVPVATVAALAAVLLVLPGREPASAATLLRSAAAAAEKEPPLPAGNYLYVRRRFTSRLAIAAGARRCRGALDASRRLRDGSVFGTPPDGWSRTADSRREGCGSAPRPSHPRGCATWGRRACNAWWSARPGRPSPPIPGSTPGNCGPSPPTRSCATYSTRRSPRGCAPRPTGRWPPPPGCASSLSPTGTSRLPFA